MKTVIFLAAMAVLSACATCPDAEFKAALDAATEKVQQDLKKR